MTKDALINTWKIEYLNLIEGIDDMPFTMDRLLMITNLHTRALVLHNCILDLVEMKEDD